MNGRHQLPAARDRHGLWLLAPSLAIALAWFLPVIAGARTLFLRDVSQFHLPAKFAQAAGLSRFELWPIDPFRGGGQPLLGNPNLSPLYPDSLLLLFADPLWSVNARFWSHLILAHVTAYFLARTLGMSRIGAAGAGALFGASGVFLSHLNFFNLVAGAALLPAFVAFSVRLASPRSARTDAPALGLLWALLLLAGDPLMAAFGLVLATLFLLCKAGPQERGDTAKPWPGTLGMAALALLGGTLVAAPQIVETLRIVGSSFRAQMPYSPEIVLLSSVHPLVLLESVVPFAFGRPDLDFWGGAAFGDAGNPFLYSLHPGILLWITLCASGLRRTPVRLACWIAIVGALFVALGAHNPVIRLLVQLPGAGLARYPAKVLIVAALGAALLGGLGLERLIQEPRRALTLVGLAHLLALAALTVAGGAFAGALQGRFGLSDIQSAAVLVQWRIRLLLILIVGGALAAVCRFAAGRPQVATGVLLALHSASQLFLLSPLLATDEARIYRSSPPQLDAVGPSESLVLAGSGFFGPSGARQFPDSAAHWVPRREWNDLYPIAGIPRDLRYELTFSPEGLDSFLARMTLDAGRVLDDAQRIRLLRSLGVGAFLIERPLDSAEASQHARLRTQFDSFGQQLSLFETLRPAPAIALATDLWPAEHLRASLDALVDPDFEPHRAATIPGEGPRTTRPAGTVHSSYLTRFGFLAEVESPEGGTLVFQRSHLPIYRATIDGDRAEVGIANLSRIGIEIPPGRHTVTLEVDRRPFFASLASSVLGVLLLGALRARGPAAPAPPRASLTSS
ncbi:MAG: hypothetical protein AAGK22_16530 [Acidobacteriota bacterium]